MRAFEHFGCEWIPTAFMPAAPFAMVSAKLAELNPGHSIVQVALR
jgi:hypothetical protein